MNFKATIKKIPFAASAYALARLARGRNARFAADYRLSSGVGSDLRATDKICSELPALIDSLAVRSILDIPCGDFVWMRHIDFGGVSYIGGDIIEELILSHQKKYTTGNRRFAVLDLVTDDLPKADLILCRDCLVHFSYGLARRAVENIKRSGAKYLLATTFPAHTNTQIVTGDWRPLNLTAPPFDFSPPIRLISEGHSEPYADKSLGLWEISELPRKI